MNYKIKPSLLQGNILIPPSKSHTLRAILFASLAKGKSIINHYLFSPDTDTMIRACQLLGAQVTVEKKQLIIVGVAGKPQTPRNIIDAGNSGQVLRFITAVAALTPGYAVITGDHSIRTHRPMQDLLEGLTQLNVLAVSTKNDGYAPILVKGPLQGGIATLNGEDSQPVSGLLIASAFAKKGTIIHVAHPGEKPWIDLTLDWFQRLSIDYQRKDHVYFELSGNACYSGFEYTVPGDFSSCAFPLIAALITRSEISLHNLDMNDAQGDKAIISELQKMGAMIEIDNNKKIIHIKKSNYFFGKKIDVNQCIDAVPILAVMGCFSQGETLLTGAAIARKKESDRLSTMTQELKKMGADIVELKDGLVVKPAKLAGALVYSHQDHRVAMALTIAGLSATGETIVENTHCVNKSYPHFLSSLQKLGASIETVV